METRFRNRVFYENAVALYFLGTRILLKSGLLQTRSFVIAFPFEKHVLQRVSENAFRRRAFWKRVLQLRFREYVSVIAFSECVFLCNLVILETHLQSRFGGRVLLQARFGKRIFGDRVSRERVPAIAF